MTQYQLDRKVAQATGESVDLIRRLGFSELCLPAQMPHRPAHHQAIARSKNKPASKTINQLRAA